MKDRDVMLYSCTILQAAWSLVLHMAIDVVIPYSSSLEIYTKHIAYRVIRNRGEQLFFEFS